ncbi:hypothetical protein THH46_24335 [Pseudomonas sp. NA13]
MELSCGVHCASFCYSPARQAWGASHPSGRLETSGAEPWKARLGRLRGSFSLHPGGTGFAAISTGIFRQHFFTSRNAELPCSHLLRIDCKLTVGSYLFKNTQAAVFEWVMVSLKMEQKFKQKQNYFLQSKTLD